MTIKSELMNIQHAHPENVLHPNDVVEWAKDNPGSLVYKSLEWDDKRAAEGYRLAQVRRLIQIHVVTEEYQPMVVSLSIDRKAGGGYRDMQDVGAKPDLRQIMLDDALAELERVKAKYSRLQELVSVWEATEQVAARVPQSNRRRRTLAATA